MFTYFDQLKYLEYLLRVRQSCYDYLYLNIVCLLCIFEYLNYCCYYLHSFL